MPNELPLPEDMAHLLEKREIEDRRQRAQADEPAQQQDEAADRRSGEERRGSVQSQSDSGSD